jgi:hypothetical protein
MQNIDLFMRRVNIYKEVEGIHGPETLAEYEIAFYTKEGYPRCSVIQVIEVLEVRESLTLREAAQYSLTYQSRASTGDITSIYLHFPHSLPPQRLMKLRTFPPALH